MSLPPLRPEATASGIVVDPQTLERVVPTSRRKDGS
jgi:partner of Y14 and mago protein